jgi:hypothetical protein
MTTFENLDEANKADVNFTGAYTRVTVSSFLYDGDTTAEPGQSTVPALKYPEAGITDYFLGKKYDLNLSVKVDVGQYQGTIPLATVSNSRGKEGISALRDLTHEAGDFPWFLVKPGARPTVVFQLSGSQTLQSGAAGGALKVALAAIKAVAPEADVVTTLSASSVKAKAEAVDTAISKLFSSAISEGHRADTSFDKWTPTGGFYLSLRIPAKEGDWNGVLQSVGGWRVNMDSPRASIFSDIYLCKTSATRCDTDLKKAADKVYDEVQASDVLGFPLLGGKDGAVTVKTFLLKLDAYGKALTAFSGVPKNDTSVGDGFCKSVRSAVGESGLNHVDADIIVWAAIRGLQFPSIAHDSWTKGAGCKLPNKLTAR